ncbi:MAG: response regulator [Bdellovibrionales bacterium]|nr:response regulator [Bdellovibrionales bacterium]
MAIPREINILIVDDFYATRKLLKKSLKTLGFRGEIFEADQVSLARDILTNNPLFLSLDFIISDIDMPGESGLDLLTYVKANENFSKIPFLILSAITNKHIVLDAIDKGVDNYLLKPWDDQALLKKMENSWTKVTALE